MKNQVIELLNNQMVNVNTNLNLYNQPCQMLFSKEDVISMLSGLITKIEKLEEKPNVNIDLESLRNELDTEIVHIISYHDYDENITLDIDRDRTIEVSFDENYLEREVKSKIEEIFSNLEEEMENNESENVVIE